MKEGANAEHIAFINTDVAKITIIPPSGHLHLRTTIKLKSGEEIVLQEATVANLVRAYIDVKTHPQRTSCRLVGRELTKEEMKKGFAPWQLLED